MKLDLVVNKALEASQEQLAGRVKEDVKVNRVHVVKLEPQVLMVLMEQQELLEKEVLVERLVVRDKVADKVHEEIHNFNMGVVYTAILFS